MKTPSRQPGTGEDRPDGAAWCAVAAALARELAAVRDHLAVIESLLGLRVPIAVPGRCPRWSCLTEQDQHRLSGTPTLRVAPTLAAGLSRRAEEVPA